MSTIKRREFFKLMASASSAYCVLRLTGCGPASPASGAALCASVYDGDGTVTMYDLVMEGWSTLGSGFLGDNGTLPATTIKANVEVTLDYVQDDHGHKFTLTPDHFLQLRKGEKIQVDTTVALDHYHHVVIDPAHRAPGGVGLVMPIDPTAPVVPPGQSNPKTEEKMYAGLSDDQAPNLYLSGSAEMDDTSVQYCLDVPAKCDADETHWQTLHRATRTDKQVFISDRALIVDAANGELPFSVRGKRKSDGALLKFLLKLVAKT